jgi:hypothetical protein
MRCDDVRTLLPELSRLHGTGKHLGEAAEHILACDSCRAEARSMGELWSILGTWEVEEPPPGLGQAVRAQILAELQREREAAVRRKFWRGLRYSLLPVILGVGATSVSVAAISRHVAVWAFSPLEILSCGIVWAGVYIVAFWIVLGGGPEGKVKERVRSLRVPAVMGLVAMVLCFVMGRTCSIATAIEYCRTSAWLRSSLGGMDLASAYFVMGSLYALLPMIAGSALVGRGRPMESRVRRGLYAGLAYAALLLPAVYLQCGSFTLGVALSWMGGSLLGALGGGVSGCWLAWRSPAPSPAL